jgi:predicted polyphosphate/ATP-dependent NAD kinase
MRDGEHARVGLVVNPNAAHDVRRLTSLAPVIDMHHRVNLVARILCGLAAGGPVEVLHMRTVAASSAGIVGPRPPASWEAPAARPDR